ncbi:hypothetical protein DL93DRAFT_1117489 [Clavulina sp. PMI_390]|nr:hypothetical protein DL93DRAFT_1117489 [Clavulina sp. PMI_390]
MIIKSSNGSLETLPFDVLIILIDVGDMDVLSVLSLSRVCRSLRSDIMQSRSLWLAVVRNLLRSEHIPETALAPNYSSLPDLIRCATRKIRLSWDIQNLSKPPRTLPRHDVVLGLPPIFSEEDLAFASCDAMMLLPEGRWLLAMGGTSAARYLACWDLRAVVNKSNQELQQPALVLPPATFISFQDPHIPPHNHSPYVFHDCAWDPVQKELSILIGQRKGDIEIYRWDYRTDTTFTRVASICPSFRYRKVTLARIGARVLFNMRPSGVSFWDWERDSLTKLSAEAEARYRPNAYDCQFTAAGTAFTFSVSSSSYEGHVNILFSPLFHSEYHPHDLYVDTLKSKLLTCSVARLRHEDELHVDWLQSIYPSHKEVIVGIRIHFDCQAHFVFISVSNDVTPTLVMAMAYNASPPSNRHLADFFFAPKWVLAAPVFPHTRVDQDEKSERSLLRRLLDRVLRRRKLQSPATTGSATRLQSSSDHTLQSAAHPSSLQSDGLDSNSFDFIIFARLLFKGYNTGISFPSLQSDTFRPANCAGICGHSGIWVFHKPTDSERYKYYGNLSLMILKYE